jgi:5-methylcytosine-specific restriction enzyme subunit McrC
MPIIDLHEWQEATPDTTPALRDAILPRDRAHRDLLDRLHRHRKLTVREMRDGLTIATRSFVGSIDLGPVTLRIHPKVDGRPFSVLLGYAIGLPQIELLPEHDVRLTATSVQDLLASKLAEEATRLIARGLHRQYVSRDASLARPRGRILFDHQARDAALGVATLPCRFHERDDNVLPNRVLLAGLRVAARVALDSGVRARVLKPASILTSFVSPVALAPTTFRALERGRSRLTASYDVAFDLIRLLIDGEGLSTTPDARVRRLPGFLFDMNRLFQDALGRFLREWLADGTVDAQYPLRDIFKYQPGFNPLRRRTPTPRPDFVVTRERQVVAIADAKYRDLWTHALPRDMLYQLTIYALSQTRQITASILYATTAPEAREARIAVTDPLTGAMRGQVCLRPVNLTRLADVIRSARNAANDQRRRAFASELVYAADESLSVMLPA